MALYRHTSFLVIGAILVWIIYYSQISTFGSQPSTLRFYEGRIRTDAEVDSLLAADAFVTGSSQLKHHESQSANRFDIANYKQQTSDDQALIHKETTEDLLAAKDYRNLWAYPPQWSVGEPSTESRNPPQPADSKKPVGKVVSAGQASQKPKILNLYSATFPKQIWQYSSPADRSSNTPSMQKWDEVNKDLERLWLSDDKADHFVRDTFAGSRKSLVNVWDELSSAYRISPTLAAVRSNLLRYLLLLIHGGIYTDIDTVPLIHADHYIPTHLAHKYIDAIIGMESNEKGVVSFLTSTMASKAYHPLFLQAVERVISNLEYLKHRQGVTSLAQLKLSQGEVNAASGPLMFTDVVLHVLQDQTPKKNINGKFFEWMTEPELVGNILVLPIGAFNAHHKLDPYGGEMLGLQGTRLVMRAGDDDEESSPPQVQSSRVAINKQITVIPNGSTHVRSKTSTSTPLISIIAIPKNFNPATQHTPTSRIETHIDYNLVDDAEDRDYIDVVTRRFTLKVADEITKQALPTRQVL